MSTNHTPPSDPTNPLVAPSSVGPVGPVVAGAPVASHVAGAAGAPGAAGPRAGTVIWGLLFVTIGIVTVVKVSGREVDVELLAIGGLAVAGLALLLTAVIGSARSRRRI